MSLTCFKNLFKKYSLSNWIFFALHIMAIFAAGLTFYPMIDSLLISILCLLALIPLSGTLAEVTEWITQRSSPILAGVLNAAFGNIPELIFGLFSVANKEYDFLLAVCIGSVLSNALLAVGCTIIIGHVRNPQNNVEKYNSIHKNGFKLLFFSSLGYVISYLHTTVNGTPSRSLDIMLSIVLISVYFVNNWYTFKIVRQIENKDQNLIDGGNSLNIAQYFSPVVNFGSKLRNKMKRQRDVPMTEVGQTVISPAAPVILAVDLSEVVVETTIADIEEGMEAIENEVSTTFGKLKTIRSWIWITVTLIYATLITSLLSNGITEQISDLSTKWGLSPRFIGGILVALVGNLCEHTSTIVTAYKGDIDAGLQICLSSSLQINMFMIPAFVIGSSYLVDDMLYLGTDPILVGPLFLTSILLPFTLSSSILDIFGAISMVALYVMFAMLFYVN